MMTEKDKIFYNVWYCAYQRAHEYKNTPRGNREWETVKMCLKHAKWWKYEEDRRTVLNPSHAVVATDDSLWYHSLVSGF